MKNKSKPIEIQVLPTMGMPYSMKTVRAGRKDSEVALNAKDNLMSGMYSSSSRTRKIKKRQRPDILAGRILRFEKSTEGQKNIAKRLLAGEANLSDTVIKINKTLSNKFKGLYKEVA